LDDDDDITDEFLIEILSAIKNDENVDVITFKQITHINNDEPSIIHFSLKHENEEYYPGGIIRRKPFHMCAWNSKKAKAVTFKDISLTEDWCWIEELCKLCNREYFIDKVLHKYIFNSKTTTSIK
jgi:hypothetical protein